jgi:hypothetical protein
MAAHAHGVDEPVFIERRLGNSGVGTLMDFGNGTTMVDTMYYPLKTERSRYTAGFSLRAMSDQLGIGSKMKVDLADETAKGQSNMIVYNIMDAYLHASCFMLHASCRTV